MSELRILLIEDVEDDALLINRTLSESGYTLQVRRVETDTEFEAALDEAAWDVVLADWTLPHFSALRGLATLQARDLDLPFIIVSGTVSDESAVAAMKAGAHDMVHKQTLSRLSPAVARELRDAAERAARRAADERYRTLARNFPNGAVLLFDVDLRYTLADGAGLADVGLTQGALEGRTVWESFPSEMSAILEPIYRAALDGNATNYDLPFADRIYENHVLPVTDTDNRITGGMVVLQDVTGARQAAQAQRQAAEQARLRAMLVEQVNDAVIGTDLQFNIQSWNPAAERIYGWRSEEVTGKVLSKVIPGRRYLDGQSGDDMWASLQRAGVWSGVAVHPHRDGHDLLIDSVVQMVRDESGAPISLVAVNRDSTARYHAETALRRSEAYFRALTEHGADLVTIVDRYGTTLYCSPSMERVLGEPPEVRVGTSAFAYIHPADQPHAKALFADLLRSPGASLPDEFRVLHRDGTWRVLDSTATNLLDDPDVAGIVINSRDVTDRKRIEEQLAHDALHDPLTALPNRTLFFDRVNQALDRVPRTASKQLGLLYLDLDQFKTINDSLGHLTGDRLLQEVARRLTRCVRAGDSVARLGGDEFAILSEDLPSIHEMTAITERVQAVLAEPVLLADETLQVSASIGVMVGGASHTAEELLRGADIAMYRAKRLGRSRMEVFDPTMLDEALARLRVEAELREAIATNQLVLHYQPIVATASNTIVGVEALVRWQHPRHGLLGPGAFVPIAEETGLIVPLGTWVLQAACAQAVAWQQAGLPSIFMSVNVAAQQLRDPAFVTEVHDALRTSALDPQCLTLEVTETGAMSQVELTIQVLTELRALGLGGIAVDDFGTGYSSLSMLQQLPITHIKIDRSFISDLDTNPSNVTLARTIIAMGYALGLTVVAEGVETAAQQRLLREHACDIAQGFLFGRPEPAEALQFRLGKTLQNSVHGVSSIG